MGGIKTKLPSDSSASNIDQSLFPSFAVFLIELITPPLIIVGSNLAVDKIMISGLRALEGINIRVSEGERIMEYARSIKGKDEILAMKCALSACEKSVEIMEAHAKPGLSENEVWSFLHSENIKNVTAPLILIAGCGTGQQSITTASRFSNCHVTAVDLSLASLAYAHRKSNELGLGNLEYLQADILHLHQMGKEFDIIESAGVLHHMDEPMAGWRVLVDLLKPGGLMKIGLYSELARHHIVEIRNEIRVLRVGTSEADIRKFRQSLAESHDENHQRLTTSSDFFSLSTLRDLIFHVQEHRFTLPQIKNCLNELGLKFCGFENEVATSNFREFHGNEADIYDLEIWHQFEVRNPQAFAGMYQFWCQKY